MKECWLDLYRTLNHEKMFERKSWERTGLLKPKTPQIKELVPEEKEAWWSKRETKYQLSLLSKCTPSLSSNVLSRKATERMTLFFHRTTPTKGAIMHGNYSDKLSSTCHALYTVCAERITHERSPHFCWSLAPLFPLFWFFLPHKGGHLSKSFSKAHFILWVTVELRGHVKRLWKNEA